MIAVSRRDALKALVFTTSLLPSLHCQTGTKRVPGPAAQPRSVPWIDAAWPAVDARLALHGFSRPDPLVVRVHPTLPAFQNAVDRRETWLRAYATYERIDFAPVSSWREQTIEVRTEKLCHETAHVALFRALGATEAEAALRAPPFYIREGSASVIADQTLRRIPLATLSTLLDGHTPDFANLKTFKPVVRYAIAHHLMYALVRAAGPTSLAMLPDIVRREKPSTDMWERAFRRVSGATAREIWERSSTLPAQNVSVD